MKYRESIAESRYRGWGTEIRKKQWKSMDVGFEGFELVLIYLGRISLIALLAKSRFAFIGETFTISYGYM